MNDWRLQGQEKYLQGKRLTFQKYERYSETWDHDHCEFCGAKFQVNDGDYDEGYATMDRYHWVCPDCFNDFKEKFEWEVVDQPEKID